MVSLDAIMGSVSGVLSAAVASAINSSGSVIASARVEARNLESKLNEVEMQRRITEMEVSSKHEKTLHELRQEYQRKLSEMDANLGKGETARETLQKELEAEKAKISAKDLELVAELAKVSLKDRELATAKAEMQLVKQENVKGAEELAAANKALDEQRVISQNLATELSTKTQIVDAVRAHGNRLLDKEANKIKDLQHKLDCLALTHRESLRLSETREAEIARLNDSNGEHEVMF